MNNNICGARDNDAPMCEPATASGKAWRLEMRMVELENTTRHVGNNRGKGAFFIYACQMCHAGSGSGISGWGSIGA